MILLSLINKKHLVNQTTSKYSLINKKHLVNQTTSKYW